MAHYANKELTIIWVVGREGTRELWLSRMMPYTWQGFSCPGFRRRVYFLTGKKNQLVK